MGTEIEIELTFLCGSYGNEDDGDICTTSSPYETCVRNVSIIYIYIFVFIYIYIIDGSWIISCHMQLAFDLSFQIWRLEPCPQNEISKKGILPLSWSRGKKIKLNFFLTKFNSNFKFFSPFIFSFIKQNFQDYLLLMIILSLYHFSFSFTFTFG